MGSESVRAWWSAVRSDRFLLGTDRFHRGVLLSGWLIFTAFILYILLAPQLGRHYFPEVSEHSMFYLHKSVQMEHCFFQDCPALNDLREQTLPKEGTPTEEQWMEHALFFPVNIHLYSFLIWETKKLTGWSWIASQRAVRVFGALMISVGMAYWLLGLFGPAPAGLAMVLVLGVDGRLGEPGLLYVNPSSMCMGLSMMVWGVLVRRRQQVGWWLPLLVLLQILSHPVGYGYAGITLGAYLLLGGWPARRRELLIFLAGLLAMGGFYAVSMLVDRPELWNLSPVRSIIPEASRSFLFSLDNLPAVVQFMERWMSVFHLGWFTASALAATLLMGFVAWRRFALPVFWLLIAGVLIVAIFFVRYDAVFSRYWIVAAVLLTGMVAFFLLALAEAMVFRFRQESLESRAIAVGVLGAIVLVQGIHLTSLNRRQGVESFVDRVADLAQRSDYRFDPDQVARLFDPRHPCDKVLYLDHTDNTSNATLKHAYYMEGAISCGVMVHSMVVPDAHANGRAFLNAHFQEVSHALFVNPVHTNPAPIAIRERDVRLTFWKEPHGESWRFLLHNPGPDPAVIALQELSGEQPSELAQFSVPAERELWVETPLPPRSVGRPFRLVQHRGTGPVSLQGMRLGPEPGTLLWPWDQGVEMTFLTFFIEHKKRLDVTRLTTRFTLAEQATQLQALGYELSGSVLADRGMSVLALARLSKP